MTAEPRKPGRKARSIVAGRPLTIKVTDAERARYEAAAAARGVSLSELVRGAVERDLER